MVGREHGLGLAAGTVGIRGALLVLNRLGGQYRIAADSVTAQNCIYREACAQAPLVVCSLQAGMIEGVLLGAGLEASVRPLGPIDRRSCAYSLNGLATVPGERN
jgi:hypothetical protein